METTVIVFSIIALLVLFFFLWRLDDMSLSNCKKQKTYTIKVNTHELYKWLADLPDECKRLNPFAQCEITLDTEMQGFNDISINNTDILVFCKKNNCDFTKKARRNMKIVDVDDDLFVAYKLKRNRQSKDWILALVLNALNSGCKIS